MFAITNQSFLEFAQGVATLKAASEGKYPPPPEPAPTWVIVAFLGVFGLGAIALITMNTKAQPTESTVVIRRGRVKPVSQRSRKQGSSPLRSVKVKDVLRPQTLLS